MLYTTQRSFLNTFRSKDITDVPIILFISNIFHTFAIWSNKLKKKILNLFSGMGQNNWLWNYVTFKVKSSLNFRLHFSFHCLDTTPSILTREEWEKYLFISCCISNIFLSFSKAKISATMTLPISSLQLLNIAILLLLIKYL